METMRRLASKLKKFNISVDIIDADIEEQFAVESKKAETESLDGKNSRHLESLHKGGSSQYRDSDAAEECLQALQGITRSDGKNHSGVFTMVCVFVVSTAEIKSKAVQAGAIEAIVALLNQFAKTKAVVVNACLALTDLLRSRAASQLSLSQQADISAALTLVRNTHSDVHPVCDDVETVLAALTRVRWTENNSTSGPQRSSS